MEDFSARKKARATDISQLWGRIKLIGQSFPSISDPYIHDSITLKGNGVLFIIQSLSTPVACWITMLLIHYLYAANLISRGTQQVASQVMHEEEERIKSQIQRMDDLLEETQVCSSSNLAVRFCLLMVP